MKTKAFAFTLASLGAVTRAEGTTAPKETVFDEGLPGIQSSIKIVGRAPLQ